MGYGEEKATASNRELEMLTCEKIGKNCISLSQKKYLEK